MLPAKLIIESFSPLSYFSPCKQANIPAPRGEDCSVSWQWAKPPMRAQPSSFKYLKRERQQNSEGRERCSGRGWERLYIFLECNTDHICMSLNEASPASTSQPGSGSGVLLVQVLASKSPLWIFGWFFFFNFSFSFLSFWKALYYAGSLPCSRLPPTSSPSAIVSNQFRKQHREQLEKITGKNYIITGHQNQRIFTG